MKNYILQKLKWYSVYTIMILSAWFVGYYIGVGIANAGEMNKAKWETIFLPLIAKANQGS